MYTSTQSQFFDVISRLTAARDHFPEGLDPDFDAGLDDLERAFQELRCQHIYFE
jgi:hypothetical protein